ncbi:hypothetical protein DBR42_14860 [Pelomonas sp. HMWF004]|nr:hypothetical protein DBR42_14860 [Pelomonas sp. HMWF004]
MSAATIGAAAIGGAVGSIASQGVAIAAGMQDSFSWKQVGLGAVGAGVTAGMGAAGLIGKTLAGSEYLATAARAGMSNALTQGVAVMTGLQDKFSWRSVAASAIAAPAAQAVSGALNSTLNSAFGASTLLQKTADGIVRGIVSQSVRMLVTRQGKMDYASIAADAFGNAIGESLAEPIYKTLQDTSAPIERMKRIDVGKLPDAQLLDFDRDLPAAQGSDRNDIYLNRAQEERLQVGRTVTDYGDSFGGGDGLLVDSTSGVRRAGSNQQPSTIPPTDRGWSYVLGQMKPDTRDRFVEAVCNCKDNWRWTGTQLSEVSGMALEAITGVYQGQEWPSSLNETHSRQQCVVEEMNTGSLWRGGRPIDPAFLSEVGMRRDGGNWFDPILSETGRTTFDGGPIAPGSPQRALSEARLLGKGNVVIWDHALLNNENLPISYNNTNSLVELKFAGDDWTNNQGQARQSPLVKEKLIRLQAEDLAATCEAPKQERQREMNRVIEKIGESMNKAAPLFTPGLPGLPGFPKVKP